MEKDNISPTPKWQFGHSYQNCQVIIDAVTGHDVAAVYQAQEKTGHFHAKANAKLIAAAPDLLASLTDAIKDQQTAYSVMSEANKEMGFDAPVKPNWLQKAEAAIAKATTPGPAGH